MTTLRGRTQAYSAGNKVYGSGRSNPTNGTVDPAGYVKRESDKRSGLAAAAMRRLEGNQQPQTAQTVPGQTGQLPPFMPIQLPNGQRVVPSATGQYVLDGGINGDAAPAAY